MRREGISREDLVGGGARVRRRRISEADVLVDTPMARTVYTVHTIRGGLSYLRPLIPESNIVSQKNQRPRLPALPPCMGQKVNATTARREPN